MYPRILAAAVISALALAPAAVRSEEAHVAEIKTYVADKVMPWLADTVVVDAVKAQNIKHAPFARPDVIKIDKEWQAQVGAASKPLIDAVLANKLSVFLDKKKAESNGLITEIFVMDDKGLNVGQTDVTTDYWQGDEAKWQKTYRAGPGAVFVDKVEKDEATQQLRVQVSVSIKDPATGKVIGAVTLSINVEQLSS